MNRVLRVLLLAAALLFAQHASMLHGLAHATHDIAQAGKAGAAPALDHGTDVCAAFAGLAHAAGGLQIVVPGAFVASVLPSRVASAPGSSSRVPFDSRAPPAFS